MCAKSGAYKCPKCDRIITRSNHLKRHLECHDNFRFMCLVCNMRFSNSVFLSEHQSRTDHKQHKILDKNEIKSLLKAENASKPSIPQKPSVARKRTFRCHKCNFIALTYGNLKRHLISHQYYFHKCRANGCKMNFRTFKSLKEHLAETGHSEAENKNFNIKNEQICDKNAQLQEKPDTDQPNTSNFIDTDNKNETRPDNNNFKLLIQEIEAKALKDPNKKKKDDKIECNDDSGSSSYFSACESDDDDESSKNSEKIEKEKVKEEKRRLKLKKRLEKYRTERDASNNLIITRKFGGILNFQCKICEKSFGKMGSIRTHVKGHIYANLECPKCKRILPNKTFLNMHLRAHNRLKFVCSIDDCKMKFASIYCIKKHHVADHGLQPSDSSESEDEEESDEDGVKDEKIMTRSMTQNMDLKDYRGKTSSSLSASSPSSSSLPSRSNSPAFTDQKSSIPSSFVKQLATLSLSKSNSENLETATVSTSIKVVEIENLPKSARVKGSKRKKNVKNKIKLECLMCCKKFEDSFMLMGHLIRKH